MSKVNVTNVKTGKPAQFEAEEWERVKSDPEWKGVFQLARKPKEPEEVTQAKAKAATGNVPATPAKASDKLPETATEAGK